MTQAQITEFKKLVREFYKVVEPIAEYWNGQPHLTTLMVLLQNLGFDGANCEGYSLTKENEDVHKLIKLIQSISEYKDSHFENWIYEEIDMLYTGVGWEQF